VRVIASRPRQTGGSFLADPEDTMPSPDITPVKAHVLKDARLTGWADRHRRFPSFRRLRDDDAWRTGWISFDAVTFCPDDGCIYCGLNDMTGDLLHRFDPAGGQFTSLRADRWADRYDVKIHRTLLYHRPDRCFYFGTSMLHDVEDQADAAGGKLVLYDVRRDRYDLLGVPAEKLYIQSIAADFARGLVYGFTYPAEGLFRFDIATGESRIIAWTGNACYFSQPHNPVVDRDGWLWGTYAETRAWDDAAGPHPVRLFKYHPEHGAVWFDTGLPRADDPDQLLPDPPKPDAEMETVETRHAEDLGFVDSMAYDGQRYIYVGTVAGVLARIDTHTDAVEKLCHVMATGRFPAVTVADDGTVYGGGGLRGHTQLIRYRPGDDRVEGFFNLRDPAVDDGPCRIHELAVTPDHTLYLAENDNHDRSSYLWSCRLP
jgi:hypothetical protein